MKKSTKFFALVLAVMVLSSTVFPVRAVEAADAYKSGIINALQAVEGTELAGLDFSELTVGEPIQTYVYVGDTFEQNGIYYPLLENGNLVLLAIPQDGWYQITNGLVAEINKNITRTTAFSLVYDQTRCYLYANGIFTLLVESGDQIQSRSVLNPDLVVRDNIMETNSLSVSTPLGYSSKNATNAQTRSDYIQCGVSYVTQNPYNNLCWAASCVSIMNYLTTNRYTIVELAQAHHNSISEVIFNQTINPGVETTVLRRFGGLTYTYRYGTIPSVTVIRNNIQAGKPIYSHWSVSSTQYHAVVIKGTGMNGNYAYLYVVDPQFGYTNAQLSNGAYTYTSAYSGRVLRMESASCQSW